MNKITKEGEGMNRALLLEKTPEGSMMNYQTIELPEIEKGEVRVRVKYSGINYKDRLAVQAGTKVVRKYPMIPGIDFSGVIEESRSEKFTKGDSVILTGYGYGTDQPGGYQEFVTVHEEHLIRLPELMTLKDAMSYGTAGFTAALSVKAMEEALGNLHGKKILVTGGSGGVSTLGILILKKLGAEITVATKRMENRVYLESLGAMEVISFSNLLEKRKPLSTETWDAVLDATGGEALGNILTEVKYNGIVCTSGNLSGVRFESTVFPFILRGVTLKGIDSVHADNSVKHDLFTRLATTWSSDNLHKTISKVIPFSMLKEELLAPQEGVGRVLVDMSL